jgi:hypothetical protein
MSSKGERKGNLFNLISVIATSFMAYLIYLSITPQIEVGDYIS